MRWLIILGGGLLATHVWAEGQTNKDTAPLDFPEWPMQSVMRPLSAIIIANYLLESENQDPDGRTNYVYRVEAINQEQDYYHQVNATLIGMPPEGMQIINGALQFGIIGPFGGGEYRVLSKNTLSLRKNPATHFDLTNLQWQVTGERLGPPPEKHGTISGVVLDTSSRRVEKAAVTLAPSNVAVRIDRAGEFALNFGLPEIRAKNTILINVYSEGYTDNHAKLLLTGQEEYHLTMVVKPVAAVTQVNTPYREDIAVAVPYQASLVLPAAGLIEENGLLVSETINAQLTTLDLSGTERDAFPGGDFLGISNDNPLTSMALEVIATAEARLIGVSGARYQRLAQPAALRLAVPGPLLNQVSEGENLPLWYYDPNVGIWHQEGSGIVRRDRNDSRLWIEAQINHLSWWMVARPLREVSCLRFRALAEESNVALDQLRFMVEGITFISGTPAFLRGNEWAFTTKRTKDLTNPELVRIMFYNYGVPSYLQRDPRHPNLYYQVGMPGLATSFPMPNIAMQHTTQWDNCQDLGAIYISSRSKP